jgi:hypothetical protein
MKHHFQCIRYLKIFSSSFFVSDSLYRGGSFDIRWSVCESGWGYFVGKGNKSSMLQMRRGKKGKFKREEDKHFVIIETAD